MSARNTVVLTTRSSPTSAASNTAVKFRSTCSVCSATPPETNSPVAGSIGICPEAKIRLPVRTACEYGPMARGARSVAMISFTVSQVSQRFGSQNKTCTLTETGLEWETRSRSAAVNDREPRIKSERKTQHETQTGGGTRRRYSLALRRGFSLCSVETDARRRRPFEGQLSL